MIKSGPLSPSNAQVPSKKEGPKADADLWALHLRKLGALFEEKQIYKITNIKLLSPLPRP